MTPAAKSSQNMGRYLNALVILVVKVFKGSGGI